MDIKRFESLSKEYKNIIWEKGSFPGIQDGWIPILEEFLHSVSKVLKNNNLHILQVKEKFGSLAIHYKLYKGPKKEIEELCKLAAKKSQKTCERCGSTGHKSVIGSGGSIACWIKTLCDTCSKY
jgi:hypothetical protein